MIMGKGRDIALGGANIRSFQQYNRRTSLYFASMDGIEGTDKVSVLLLFDHSLASTNLRREYLSMVYIYQFRARLARSNEIACNPIENATQILSKRPVIRTSKVCFPLYHEQSLRSKGPRPRS
jgi:hypothetical protein